MQGNYLLGEDTNADKRITVIVNDNIIKTVVEILGARYERVGGDTLLHISDKIVLTFTVLADDVTLLSAQTTYGYFEVHNIARIVPVEPDEVIFVAEEGDRISGFIAGKEGTCSLFANVSRAILNADLAHLEPPLLLAAMQLGLAEPISAT